MKVGYAGDNIPRYEFPSLVGRPVLRSGAALKDVKIKDIMIGDETNEARALLELSYPIRNGIVTNWDDMTLLWDYIFETKLAKSKDELRDYMVMLTEAAYNPLTNRQKMVEIMFERYGFSAVNVQTQAVLTLYAQGRTTGCVVDSGDGVTHVVPISDSVIIKPAIQRIDLAGREITKYFIKLLQLRGYTFNSSSDFETCREMKERLAYVGYDMDIERDIARNTTYCVERYTTPDGQVIKVGEERFQAPEILFEPELVGIEHESLSETIFRAIRLCPVDVRTDLFKNIVLSGGSTMFPGLPSRLERDLTQLQVDKVLGGDRSRLDKFSVHIVDPPRRKNFVFIGGAILAKLIANQPQAWAHREVYEESGSVVAALEQAGLNEN